MDKKEFIFPGALLALVIIVVIGLIVTHHPAAPILPEQNAATTTPTTSTTSATIASTSQDAPTNTGASYYPYGTLTLTLNQPAGFRDGMSMRPTVVVEDSRCPLGVFCIQAGTIRISLKVNSAKGTSEFRTIALGQSITVDNDVITFTSVDPVRTKGEAPANSVYRFTFTVEQNEVAGTVTGAPCYVGGCSNQLCTDNPHAISNCMYSSQYACYEHATCERQASGACGWTQTPALTACLAGTSAQ